MTALAVEEMVAAYTACLPAADRVADNPMVQAAGGLGIPDAFWDNVGAMRMAIAYLGYDPRKTLLRLHALAKQAVKVEGAVMVHHECGAHTFSLYEACDLPTDIPFLITVFLERGNKPGKITEAMSDRAAAVFRRKCAQYAIDVTRAGSEAAGRKGAEVVTLARIAQTFPVHTATLILKDEIVGKITSPLIEACGGALMSLMTHTIFATLIVANDPDMETLATILNLEASILFATARARRELRATLLADLLDRGKRFVEAAAGTPFLTITGKRLILARAGLMDAAFATTDPAALLYEMGQRISALRHLTYDQALERLKAQAAAARLAGRRGGRRDGEGGPEAEA